MRTRQEALEKIEVKARIGELFNLADPNYARLNDIEHAFKLARPPPKVSCCVPVVLYCDRVSENLLCSLVFVT